MLSQFLSLAVTVSRLKKTLRDNWTHLDITAPVSWLLLVEHYVKAKNGVVVSTTSSTGPKAFLP